MGCLPNVRPNTFFEGNVDVNADIAALIMEYSHSERRKDCVRNCARSLILALNGFTFRLEQKSHQRRIFGE